MERMRNLRKSSTIRDLVAETNIKREGLIMPHFVLEGEGRREEISSMPGISRVSQDNLLRDVESDMTAGIKSVILFGIPQRKDASGTEAWNSQGALQQAVKSLKKSFGDELLVITDVCLCEYTDHGHCGLVEDGKILNDPSIDLLAKTALSHARAGADMVAPSDMMDGRVRAIRDLLDEESFFDVPIMSYSAKYCSAFYGPFRDAAGSAPQFGDRKTYQMDPRNGQEAERAIINNIEQGADIVMVKPALSYMDIIKTISQISTLPLCVYNVSGEYSMVKSAAMQGFIDEGRIVNEILTSFFRAGADMVISYHAREAMKNKWI